MASTYDNTLPSDKDWVRFLSGDRGTSTASPPTVTGTAVSDEEIAAILNEEENKYYAAARVGNLVIAKGHGAVSKTVGNLSISFGDSPESAYRDHVKKLRERGSELLQPRKNRIWNNL